MKELDIENFKYNMPLNFAKRLLVEEYIMQMNEERFVLYISLFCISLVRNIGERFDEATLEEIFNSLADVCKKFFEKHQSYEKKLECRFDRMLCAIAIDTFSRIIEEKTSIKLGASDAFHRFLREFDPVLRGYSEACFK